jgi:NAD-dependent deacetylase
MNKQYNQMSTSISCRKNPKIQRIILFTGAGTSAEAGIPTFRTNDNALWKHADPLEVCNIMNFRNNCEKVCDFFNIFRKIIQNAQPTSFHHSVKEWQSDLSTQNIKLEVYTQNVDDLFEKASVENVYHIHGDIRYMQCIGKNHTWFIGYDDMDINVSCPQCGCKKCKPGVVFFNEMAPLYPQTHKMLKSLNQNDVLLVTGTSCNVFPIEDYLCNMRPYKIFSALEIPDSISKQYFDMIYLEPCTTAIRKIMSLDFVRENIN